MKNLTAELKKSMAARFRKIRSKLDLTQKKFADKMGVKIDSIVDIELERHLPTIPFIISLYKELKISVYWLILGEGEMFAEDKDAGLSRLKHFKKAFPDVPAEKDVLELVESLAIPVLKNTVILKFLELKETHRTKIEEYKIEKA